MSEKKECTQRLFFLSKEESSIVERNRVEGWPVNALIEIIDRACMTSAHGEPLSEELRAEAERIVSQFAIGVRGYAVAAELLRRFPKPEPKKRTAEELREELESTLAATGEIDFSALDELVALAKKAETLLTEIEMLQK